MSLKREAIHGLLRMRPAAPADGQARSMHESRIAYAREQLAPYATRQQLARAALAGRRRRVAPGAYVSEELWQSLGEQERYRLRVRAVVATRRFRPVLSHESAAAVHGLPMIGSPPDHVHIVVDPGSGGRSRNGVIKHRMPFAGHARAAAVTDFAEPGADSPLGRRERPCRAGAQAVPRGAAPRHPGSAVTVLARIE